MPLPLKIPLIYAMLNLFYDQLPCLEENCKFLFFLIYHQFQFYFFYLQIFPDLFLIFLVHKVVLLIFSFL